VEDRFRNRLQREFEQRRQANARYSLRAFATFLGTDHSTLSQILRSQRPLPLTRIRAWAKKLGLEPEVTAAYVAAEHLPDPQSAARESQIRHWTAEASAIMMHPVHWDIVRLSRTREFRSDSRWVAEQTGATVDEVNIAFARLLRLELLRTRADGRWVVTNGQKVRSEREFQKLALTRVREKAAEFHVKLPATLRLR
jgi:transcriptional regulator with XRE-family HTH domain